jgi:hypothetical protein
METLTLEQLAPYLPYGLKCQYEGILNGREISKQRKEYHKENEPFANWEHYTPIEQIKGLKIAPLKTIRVYKKYWVATCSVYNHGQKVFYNGFGIKPILRNLSDLTKEIEHKGERLCVMSILFPMLETHSVLLDVIPDKAEDILIPLISNNNMLNVLLKYHFDVFGLIEKGLAIDINQIK